MNDYGRDNSGNVEKQKGRRKICPAAETAAALKDQITALTPEERRKVEELKEQIDLTDSQMLMQYGARSKAEYRRFL